MRNNIKQNQNEHKDPEHDTTDQQRRTITPNRRSTKKSKFTRERNTKGFCKFD